MKTTYVLGVTEAEFEVWQSFAAAHASFYMYASETKDYIALLGALYQTCFPGISFRAALHVLVNCNEAIPFDTVLVEGTNVTIVVSPRPCLHFKLADADELISFDCVKHERTDDLAHPTSIYSVELHPACRIFTRDDPWSL